MDGIKTHTIQKKHKLFTIKYTTIKLCSTHSLSNLKNYCYYSLIMTIVTHPQVKFLCTMRIANEKGKQEKASLINISAHLILIYTGYSVVQVTSKL